MAFFYLLAGKFSCSANLSMKKSFISSSLDVRKKSHNMVLVDKAHHFIACTCLQTMLVSNDVNKEKWRALQVRQLYQMRQLGSTLKGKNSFPGSDSCKGWSPFQKEFAVHKREVTELPHFKDKNGRIQNWRNITKYSAIPLLRLPKIKTFYLLKSLFWKFKLHSTFSTPIVHLIRDHLWDCSKCGL